MKSLYTVLFLVTLFLCSFNTVHAQWNRQYPLPKLEDVLDIDVGTDGLGFAVGPNDLLLRAQIGTGQWEVMPGFGEGWRFESVDYVDGSGGTIAAAGGEGLILTTDRGAHWTQISGAPAGIHTIHIISPTHIIVGYDEDVAVWKNSFWTNLNMHPSAALKGAFILDEQHIWANTFGATSTIYYTTDGGLNWNTNAVIPRVDVVRFFNTQNGIALDGRNVHKSTDGGQNWTLIAANGLNTSANDLAFGTTSNVLVAATLNAKPNISTDGGVTWTAITTPLINQRSYSVVTTSNTNFWIGNDLTGVMHSTDGGNTWAETCGPVRNLIQDVYFVNRTTGFAVGQKGMLLRTEDAGENWEDITFGTRSHLSIHGLTENDLWIGTSQRILHSDDAGDTWTEAFVVPGGNINDILAITQNRILAASTSGIIYLSKNGGMSWDSVYNSGNQMRSIAMIDNQHYMATGFNGVVVRSDDQGQTWHTVAVPLPDLQYEQSFFLDGEGWLITSSFKKAMWHTTDNGNTWDTLALPIDRFWDGVYFITKDTGVIVGRTSSEGRAYLTFDGGHHWQSGYITSYPLYGATGAPNPNGTAWIFGFGSDIENLTYCNSIPVITDLTGNQFPCEADTVSYSIFSQDVEEYDWHFPPGWQIVGNANNDTVQIIVGHNSGTIAVSGSNVCGETIQLGFSAGVNLLPKVFAITGEPSPCVGHLMTYTANQSDGDSFSWTVPADWAIQSNPTLATITVQVGSMSGTISVIASNDCSTIAPFNFNVSPRLLPTIAFLSGNLSPCPGDTVTFVFNTVFSNSISLGIAGLDDWTLFTPTIPNTIQGIAGTIPGNLEFTANNDCGQSSPLSLHLNPKNVPVINLVVNGSIISTSTAGIAYQWFKNNVLISGATNDTLKAVVSGVYKLKITFANGCKAFSGPVEVVVTGTHDLTILPLQVFPVPTDKELIISGVTGEYAYSVYDLLGKKLKTGRTSETKLQVGELTKGLYMLEVVQGNQIYVAKFIRN